MTTREHPTAGRIGWIDIARGVALVAMAIYHFCWDIEFFGYLEPYATASGPLKWFARSIASSFLILVGVSLVLAHTPAIRWRGFAVRLAMVAAAALAITAATYFFTPSSYVFFGILHQIAFASVFGLLFLRFPAVLLALLAVFWISVIHWGKTDMMAHPALTWIGLSPFAPRSNDFVPVFPWFGAVLAGMTVGRVMKGRGVLAKLAANPPGSSIVSRGLQFAGRHSLAVYLVHQPVLISLVYLATLLAPPAPPTPQDSFFRSCRQSCVETNDQTTCEAFCACAITRLSEQGLFDGVFRGEITQDNDPRVGAVSQQCAIKANIDGN